MSDERRGGPLQDAWWVAVLAVAATVLLGSAAETVLRVARADLWQAARGLAYGVAAGWFVAGAWLRTSWGRPSDVSSHRSAPPLSARAAALLTAAAAVCVAAASIALFVQLVTAG